MKYSLTVISLLLFLLLLSCQKRSEDWTSFSPDFMIKYIEGSGWTGHQFSTTIVYPDTLIINEKENNPTPKERASKYQLDKDEMDSLFQDLNKLKYINLKDYYGFGQYKPTDLPVTYFKYRNSGQVDSALIYCPDENEVPEELLTLLGRINRLVINHDTPGTDQQIRASGISMLKMSIESPFLSQKTSCHPESMQKLINTILSPKNSLSTGQLANKPFLNMKNLIFLLV